MWPGINVAKNTSTWNQNIKKITMGPEIEKEKEKKLQIIEFSLNSNL